MSALSNPITYRRMIYSDIPAGLALCRACHWNQLSRDWECFLNWSPDGCRVAIKEDRVVGTVTTLSYRDRRHQPRFDWIAMVLVDPLERRQGIGQRLMREALAYLGDRATIRLDATPAGHPVYRKLDFVDEYGLLRMEVSADARPVCIRDPATRLMVEDDLPQVLNMDDAVFGADRSLLLRGLFHGAPDYARICVRDGRMTGYMFGRHGFRFEHLGPVIAEDRRSADLLVQACLCDQRTAPFILDASQGDADWLQCLQSLGFKEQRPFLRMYRGKNPYPGIPGKQYAILGPEFG